MCLVYEFCIQRIKYTSNINGYSVCMNYMYIIRAGEGARDVSSSTTEMNDEVQIYIKYIVYI